jgi:hypothetical protein
MISGSISVQFVPKVPLKEAAMQPLLRRPGPVFQYALLLGLMSAVTWAGASKFVRLALAKHCEYRRCHLAFEQAQAESRDIQRRLQETHERRLAKVQICRDLMEGRTTLAQACRRLRQLPCPPQRFLELLRSAEAGATDDERLCNHIIDCACDLLESEPARAEALRQRLLAELKAGS